MTLLEEAKAVFMRFYKNDTIDWWEGCVGTGKASNLTLSEEGLYKRVCNWMYMTGEDLPDNDLIAAAILRVNHNQYKAVISSLIEKGKLIRAQGYVFNERVRMERERYVLTREGRAVAAKKRERAKGVRVERVISGAVRSLTIGKETIEKTGGVPSVTIINTPPVIANDPPSHWAKTPPVFEQDPPSPSSGYGENRNEINGLFESLDQTTACTRALESKNKKRYPPAPQGGDRAESASQGQVGAPKTGLAKAILSEAKLAYNVAAQAHGFALCRSWTAARESLLERRLRDIGGIEPFKRALGQIASDAFLMGLRPGRDGEPPFRLDIDRLLSTRSGLGDVLAKLVDRAGHESAAVARGEPSRVGPNGRQWGWWRGSEEKLRKLEGDYWRKAIEAARPNGEWPWWVLGAPPGHAECLISFDVLTEGRWVEKYQGRVMARPAPETGSGQAIGGRDGSG